MHAFLKNGKWPSSRDSADSYSNSKKSYGIKDSSKWIRLTTKESIVIASSQSVIVAEININDNDTTSGRIASDGYNFYNVSEGGISSPR